MFQYRLEFMYIYIQGNLYRKDNLGQAIFVLINRDMSSSQRLRV